MISLNNSLSLNLPIHPHIGLSDLNNLGPKYRRQVWRTYCGVASLATAWDLLEDNNAVTPENAIFDSSSSVRKPSNLDPTEVKRRGMTLDELHRGAAIMFDTLHHYQVDKRQPDSVEALRQLFVNHFQSVKVIF